MNDQRLLTLNEYTFLEPPVINAGKAIHIGNGKTLVKATVAAAV